MKFNIRQMQNFNYEKDEQIQMESTSKSICKKVRIVASCKLNKSQQLQKGQMKFQAAPPMRKVQFPNHRKQLFQFILHRSVPTSNMMFSLYITLNPKILEEAQRTATVVMIGGLEIKCYEEKWKELNNLEGRKKDSQRRNMIYSPNVSTDVKLRHHISVYFRQIYHCLTLYTT